MRKINNKLFVLFIIITFIAGCSMHNESNTQYKLGVDYLGTKKYQEAIYTFSKVDKEDIKNYDNAQKKSNVCKQILINKYSDETKQYFKQKKYDDVNNNIKYIFELTKKLPPDIANIQKQSNIILKKKKAIADKKSKELARKKAEQNRINAIKQAKVDKANAIKQAKEEKVSSIKLMKSYEFGNGTVGIGIIKAKNSHSCNGYTANGNGQFVWLDIAALNNGTGTTHVNPNYFTLSTEDGQTVNYNTETTFNEAYLDATNLSSNTYTSGWLIF